MKDFAEKCLDAYVGSAKPNQMRKYKKKYVRRLKKLVLRSMRDGKTEVRIYEYLLTSRLQDFLETDFPYNIDTFIKDFCKDYGFTYENWDYRKIRVIPKDVEQKLKDNGIV